MAGLDDSVILLSSMSPKIVTKTKAPASGNKKVSKLCLRRHFRQSLEFEKAPPRIAAPAPALLADGESTASTESSKEKNSNEEKEEEVVIIPDSDDGEEEEEKGARAKGIDACPALSESRYNVISNWLEKVHSSNKERGFEDVAVASYSDASFFSDLSVIYGERRLSATGQSGAVNSTFIGGGKCLRFDQLFDKAGGQANEEKASCKTKSVIKDGGDVESAFEAKPNGKQKVTKSKSDERRPRRREEDDEKKKMADVSCCKTKPLQDGDVESVSWRNAGVFEAKPNGKQKVTKSKSEERRPRREEDDEKKKMADVFCCKTKSVKDGDVESAARKNADAFKAKENRKQEVTSSKINERQKEGDEKRKTAETKKDSSEPDEPSPGRAALQEEQEKLLDELYGHSWRVNKDKVFAKSETKQKRRDAPVPPPIKRREPQTERPPKTTSAALYRNPYLDSEVTKSRNLLRSLHASRARKMMESPLVTRLRELCDSDTNSEGTEGSGRKLAAAAAMRLVFDEEEGSDSDKENVGGALANLEERVRKRLGFEDEGGEENVDDRDGDSDTAESDGSSEAEWTRQVVRKAATDDVVKKKAAPKERKPLSFLASLSPDAPSSECDASARLYRDHYRMYKSQLARKLFELYNERVFEKAIPADTPLEWNDKLRGTAGNCRCRRALRSTGAVEYSVSIALSTKVLDSAYRLRDTLIHEMCHAAAYVVNKVAEGHGPHWRAWAAKATKVFPELPPIKVCHNYQINTKYTYKCVGCGYSIGRHSKSLNVERKRCGHCYGKFELHLNKTGKDGGVRSVPVTPKKEVTGFALFVKENYAELRTPERKHKDVMQLLSKKFNEMKTQ